MSDIYTKHEAYWLTIFWLCFAWGYISSIFSMLESVVISDSIAYAIFLVFIWQFIAGFSGLVNGILGGLFWGILLFIPYLIVKKLV